MDNANIEHPYPVTSIGAVDFMKKEIPPRELILAPWLPVQGLVLIYAKRGIGKTYFGINSAYAIATGREYLGWQAPKKRSVLYIDGEMPAAAMQERFRTIIGPNPDPELDTRLQLITPDLQEGIIPNLATPEGQEEIEPLLEKVDVIFLDNLSCLFREPGENDADQWIPIQGWLGIPPHPSFFRVSNR